jgi:hypothetical protein
LELTENQPTNKEDKERNMKEDNQSMELFKGMPESLATVECMTLDAQDLVKGLLTQAAKMAAVTTPAGQQAAAELAVRLRRTAKMMEEQRQKYVKPFNTVVGKINEIVGGASGKLVEEQRRLERLNTQFAVAEQKKAQEAEAERLRKVAALSQQTQQAEQVADELAGKARGPKTLEKAVAAQQQVESLKEQKAALIAAPAPAPSKAKGQSLQKKPRYKVVDVVALYGARPYCCKLDPKPAAIASTCFPSGPDFTEEAPDRSVPGLELWWEQTTVTSVRGSAPVPASQGVIDLQPGLDWVDCDSSQVRRFAHTPSRQVLTMEFKSGGVYEYADFPASKFEALKAAESVGKFLGSEIKGKHAFKRLN